MICYNILQEVQLGQYDIKNATQVANDLIQINVFVSEKGCCELG